MTDDNGLPAGPFAEGGIPLCGKIRPDFEGVQKITSRAEPGEQIVASGACEDPKRKRYVSSETLPEKKVNKLEMAGGCRDEIWNDYKRSLERRGG